jgi:hypothetical protein
MIVPPGAANIAGPFENQEISPAMAAQFAAKADAGETGPDNEDFDASCVALRCRQGQGV